MKIQWLGHSAFHISTDNTDILIDPFLRDNPACPFDPEEVKAEGEKAVQAANDVLIKLENDRD